MYTMSRAGASAGAASSKAACYCATGGLQHWKAQAGKGDTLNASWRAAVPRYEHPPHPAELLAVSDPKAAPWLDGAAVAAIHGLGALRLLRKGSLQMTPPAPQKTLHTRGLQACRARYRLQGSIILRQEKDEIRPSPLTVGLLG